MRRPLLRAPLSWASHAGSPEALRGAVAGRFTRDAYTWVAYLLLGYYAYLQAILGPALPFLRAELRVNYAVGSLHVSAFAFGMMLAGLFGDQVAGRWGRRATLWGGAAGLALGALLLALGHSIALTLAGALLMGAIGSLVMVMIQATLAARHGERRAIAFTEANVVASLLAGLAPFLVGAFQGAGVGWRGALFVAIGALAALVALGWRAPVPEAQAAPSSRRRQTAQRSIARSSDAPRRGLPMLYWVYWTLTVFCVAVEWCVVVWSAQFLRDVGGVRASDAAAIVSVFFLAEVAGRLVGSRLTRRVPAARLALITLLVTLVGFVAFWLLGAPALRVLALFLTGLGVANLFPLALTLATSAAPHALDRASARVSLAAGVAIFAAPFALGALADRFGLARAYSVVVVFLALALATLALAARLRRAPHAHSSATYTCKEAREGV